MGAVTCGLVLVDWFQLFILWSEVYFSSSTAGRAEFVNDLVIWSLNRVQWSWTLFLSLRVRIWSSSSGPDRIPTGVIRAILPAILSPLAKLVNLSFEKGIFLKSMKRTKVIVLYKGISRSDPTNYRPISLLCVVSKIFEKPMLSRLLSFQGTK